MTSASRSERLLDAQVAWLLGRLTGDELDDLVSADVDALLDLGSRITLAEVIDPALVQRLTRELLAVVPPSAGASTLVAMAADALYDGPTDTFSLADVLDRENAERIADEVLANTDVLAAALDDLTRSPMVTSLASRFVTRIVADVVQTNRAMAEKIPGVGSLVSFGASAAGKVVGAADKQLEAVLGDTAAKGAAFAMRRLNKIVVETLRDPATKAAVLEVFDLYADQPIPHLRDSVEREDVHRVAGLIQDIVLAGAPTEPVHALVDVLVDGLLRTYGAEPVATLVEDLGIERDVLVEHAVALAGRAVAAAHATGELERLVRERLAPFWELPEVRAILDS